VTPELARVALAFLERTRLEGREVDAYGAVRAALIQEAQLASPSAGIANGAPTLEKEGPPEPAGSAAAGKGGDG